MANQPDVAADNEQTAAAPQDTDSKGTKQTLCERCGEPCGNAAVCATCLARGE